MGTQKNRLNEMVLFEHPNEMLKLMGKKIFYNFELKKFVYLNLWTFIWVVSSDNGNFLSFVTFCILGNGIFCLFMYKVK